MSSAAPTAVNTAIGMMDPAYFVGKKEILNWLNNLLKLNLAKIEETSNGAVACQVMDSLFPSIVPMQKINWGAKNDYDIINNYKVLQAICQKLKIQRSIEVEKLMRARYQDNLEFMQWLKKFFELNYSGVVDDYESVERRSKGKGVSLFKPASAAAAARLTAGGARSRPGSRAATAGTSATGSRARVAGAAKTDTVSGGSVRGVPARGVGGVTAAEKENKRSAPRVSGSMSGGASVVGKGGPRRSNASATSSSGSIGMSTVTNAQAALDAEEMQRVKTQLKEATDKMSEGNSVLAGLREEVANVTQERDFYFGKLREVEVMLESYAGTDPVLKESLLSILYATDDDNDQFAASPSPMILPTPSPMAPKPPVSEESQVEEQTEGETVEAVMSALKAANLDTDHEGKSSEAKTVDERMEEDEEMSPLVAGAMLAAEEKVETARDE